MSVKVAPSILSADFANMAWDINMLERCGADLIHCDVMDGVFVPNISFGPKMIADIRGLTDLELDAHLMIIDPDRYIEKFVEAGADRITVHIEAAKDPIQTLKNIRALGCKSGIVLNPETEAKAIEAVLPYCDMVLVMSVHPGFSGQKFIPETLPKLAEIKAMVDAMQLLIDIEIDGGITVENAKSVIEAGANILVAGNTIFSAIDKKEVISKLKGE